MAGKQAKILSNQSLKRSLTEAKRGTSATRDIAMLLLSAKAGLRACEIAGLEWHMVLDAQGRVSTSIELSDDVSKYGSGRRVPMHADLRRALGALRRENGRCDGPVIRSNRGAALQPNSIVNWFRALYQRSGAAGCSSHSGRRTFITGAARRAHVAGASLRDVQLLAGHRSIETTQGYIDGDTDAQRRLVLSL